jgi:hypothetical protein
MWPSRTRSASRILEHGIFHDFLPEEVAQVTGRAKVHLVTDDLGQLDFHPGQPNQAGSFTWQEFNKEVNITVGAEPGGEDRTEQRKLLDVIAFAERREGLGGISIGIVTMPQYCIPGPGIFLSDRKEKLDRKMGRKASNATTSHAH